jgi:hypothetical protein
MVATRDSRRPTSSRVPAFAGLGDQVLQSDDVRVLEPATPLDASRSRGGRKATASHNVGTDANNPLAWINDFGLGKVVWRHVLTILDGQALYEHAPYPLALVTHPAHSVNLERHQPGIHLVE